MKSLKALYQGTEINESQKAQFREEIRRIKDISPIRNKVLEHCLLDIAQEYSQGGISSGRSLRSMLLDQARWWLKHRAPEKAKVALSVLISMYHDVEYINSQSWYDFKIENNNGVPIVERINLCVIAEIMGIDELPDMSDWPAQAIVDLINS